MIGIRGVVDAEKVILCPADENISISPFISTSSIKKTLIGKVVSKGEKISLDKLKKKKDVIWDTFDEIVGINVPLKVVEVEPEDRAKITEDTEIVILESAPNEHGFPITKILNVKTRPPIDEMTELKDIESLNKISKRVEFINKYENENEIIYFAGGYFYKIEKLQKGL